MISFQKRFCFVIFLLVCFSIFTVAHAKKFTFKLDPKAVGIIKRVSDGKTIGSAFIAGNKRYLITCAHVASGKGFVYRGVGSPKDINIKSSFHLPKFDLSVFSFDKSIKIKPLKFGDFRRIRPGDTVVYIGWDKAISKMKPNSVKVYSVGSCNNKETIVDFLEFYGVGMPGYSGGPVFNIEGKVVAIMREAWTKKGIKGGKSFLINRAFSIEMLTVFDKEIYAKKHKVPANNKEVLGLININKEGN